MDDMYYPNSRHPLEDINSNSSHKHALSTHYNTKEVETNDHDNDDDDDDGLTQIFEAQQQSSLLL
eukprot:12163447-Ditylum_brightwellii.AAC.2